MQNGCFWMHNELMGSFFKVKLKHNANCKRQREAGHDWIYDTQQNIEWFSGGTYLEYELWNESTFLFLEYHTIVSYNVNEKFEIEKE